VHAEASSPAASSEPNRLNMSGMHLTVFAVPLFGLSAPVRSCATAIIRRRAGLELFTGSLPSAGRTAGRAPD
jgi:hypothetical protein